MEFKTIEIEKDEQNFITTIIMSRPPPVEDKEARFNMINDDMLIEINQALDLIYEDSTTRVIVVKGANHYFSGGAELDHQILTQRTAWNHKKHIILGQRVFKRLRDIPIPIIAAIEGYAIGGALELAMNCDLRFASEDAILGLPEVRLGLIPGWGGTQTMVRHIGVGRAMELILQGEIINAKRAFEIGLINKIFRKDKFERNVYKVAKTMAGGCSPISMGIAKQMINYGGTVPHDIGLEMESYGWGLISSTEDFKEGLKAYLKRKAIYRNK